MPGWLCQSYSRRRISGQLTGDLEKGKLVVGLGLAKVPEGGKEEGTLVDVDEFLRGEPRIKVHALGDLAEGVCGLGIETSLDALDRVEARLGEAFGGHVAVWNSVLASQGSLSRTKFMRREMGLSSIYGRLEQLESYNQIAPCDISVQLFGWDLHQRLLD